MGHAILERVLLFGTRSADYIRASGHNGCIATEVILQATTDPMIGGTSRLGCEPRQTGGSDDADSRRSYSCRRGL